MVEVLSIHAGQVDIGWGFPFFVLFLSFLIAFIKS